LAAIGEASSLQLLAEYAVDPAVPVEVRETCQLSLDMIAWRREHPAPVKSKYMSVDPAPPFSKKEVKTLAELETIYLDPSRSMFDRYRAMFALRNMETEESVHVLAKGFQDASALFKHEIAFVFGQMQHKASIPALKLALAKEEEHAMVRPVGVGCVLGLLVDLLYLPPSHIL
jgi:deoxyhypusine monooxygenase